MVKSGDGILVLYVPSAMRSSGEPAPGCETATKRVASRYRTRGWTASASVALVTAVTVAGVPLDTLAAVGGGTGGALLIYVAPALMALRARGDTAAPAERAALWVLALAGVGLGVLGTFEATQGAGASIMGVVVLAGLIGDAAGTPGQAGGTSAVKLGADAPVLKDARSRQAAAAAMGLVVGREGPK